MLHPLFQRKCLGCINPTRGGRQTTIPVRAEGVPKRINPTRGGRQTLGHEHVQVVDTVSIPQGVDVKLATTCVSTSGDHVSIP